MHLSQILNGAVGVEEIDYYSLPAFGSGECEEEEDDYFHNEDNEEDAVDQLKHILSY